MSSGEPIPVPAGAPQKGEVFAHYKQGDQYRVVGLAIESNTDEWMVVYEPLYENPAAPLFTRPCREWREVVDWQGSKTERFSKVA